MHDPHHRGRPSQPPSHHTSPRLRPSLLILSTLFCATLSLSAGAATNLVQDPKFGLSTVWKLGANATRTYEGTYTMACTTMSADAHYLGPFSGNFAKNEVNQKAIQALKPDTRYRLTFRARQSGATAVDGRILASVTTGKKWLTDGVDAFGTPSNEVIWEGVYAENQIPLTGSFASYKLDFVTPVKPRIDGGSGAVFFQALASSNPDNAQICLSDVSLTEIGPNVESTASARKDKLAIRYNTVTPGPVGGPQRFILQNVLAGDVVVVNRGMGNVTRKPIEKVTLDEDSGVNYYELITYESKPFSVYVSRPGLVGAAASTGEVTPGTYATAAPDLKRDTLHFYYGQRSDQAIYDRRYYAYRNGLDRAASAAIGHAAKCFSGTDNFGNSFANSCLNADGSTYTKEVSGGWFDAGDYGRYTVNAAYSLWMLQNVAERLKTQGGDALVKAEFPVDYLFPKDPSRRPVSPLSALLAEAKYEMKWLLKMQIRPDNFGEVKPSSITVPVGNLDSRLYIVKENRPLFAEANPGTTIYTAPNKSRYISDRYRVSFLSNDATPVNAMQKIEKPSGLVFSALHWSQWWGGIPLAPAKNTLEPELMYPTTAATLDFAAVAAQCARVFKDVDPVFSGKCLTQAKEAFVAAKKWPSIYRWGEYAETSKHLPAISQGGGAYADTDLSDEFLWAAGELYLATKDSSYLDTFLIPSSDGSCEQMGIYEFAAGISWNKVRNLPFLSMLASGNDVELKGKTCVLPKPSSQLVKVADQFLAYAGDSVWRTGIKQQYNWASNADIASAGVLVKTADMVAPDAGGKYKAAVQSIMDYLFGLNPLGKSYVTGYGVNPARNPHHRFWAKHADINFPAPPPGLLVGGPNGQWKGSVLGIYQINNTLGEDAKYYMDNIMSTCNPRDTVGETLRSANFGGVNCYQDRINLYMTNEVAINWNAPLFWLSSFVQ